MLGLSERWLQELRSRRFAGLKRGRSWTMTGTSNPRCHRGDVDEGPSSRSAVAVGIDAYELWAVTKRFALNPCLVILLGS